MLRLLRSQKGLTLIEVMAALIILGIILVPVLGAYTTGAFLSAEARRTSQATAVGEGVLEEYLATGMQPEDPPGFELEFREEEFSEAELEARPLRQVTVTVTWQEEERQRQVSLTTLVPGSQ